MKKFFAIITLITGLAYVTPAATIWTAQTPGGVDSLTNLVTSGIKANLSGGYLNAISISPTGAASRVTIYDSWSISNIVNIGAYTNMVQTNYTATEYYTNISAYGTGSVTIGVTTNTFTAVSNIVYTVAAANYSLPTMLVVNVNSNGVYTATFPGKGLPFGRGLLLTNTAGCDISITYTKAR